MGMFDTIDGVPIKCPICGDNSPKSVQIKPGPQNMRTYKFGKDEIEINWDYPYYGSIIDRERGIVLGIAICCNCFKKRQEMMVEIIKEAKDKGEIEGKDGAHLFECKINGENAYIVLVNRLHERFDKEYLFEVAITFKDNVPVHVDLWKG